MSRYVPNATGLNKQKQSRIQGESSFRPADFPPGQGLHACPDREQNPGSAGSAKEVLQNLDRLVHVFDGDMLIWPMEAGAAGAQVRTGKTAQGKL